MADVKLPRGALRLAAEALEDETDVLDHDWDRARVALTAALEAIQRDARRQMARHLLAMFRPGPQALYTCHWAWEKALKAAAKGQPLPELPQEDTDD